MVNRKELTGTARCRIHGCSFKRVRLNVNRHIYKSVCTRSFIYKYTKFIVISVPNFYS